MHPTQSENLSHTSWIADSPTGVSSTTSLLRDIPKLWRLVCRKKSPDCSSDHSRIRECCYFKPWWKSHQRAKSSPSPSCTSILNIFQFLQQVSLQQEHCWLQHNSGFWKGQVYSASHAHLNDTSRFCGHNFEHHFAKYWLQLSHMESYQVSLPTYSLLGVFMLLC